MLVFPEQFPSLCLGNCFPLLNNRQFQESPHGHNLYVIASAFTFESYKFVFVAIVKFLQWLHLHLVAIGYLDKSSQV